MRSRQDGQEVLVSLRDYWETDADRRGMELKGVGLEV